MYDIENFVCYYLDKGDKIWLIVLKDICELKWFVFYLYEIEIVENIFEKYIMDMKSMGSFCREFNFFIVLKERVIFDLCLIVMVVKMSIL